MNLTTTTTTLFVHLGRMDSNIKLKLQKWMYRMLEITDKLIVSSTHRNYCDVVCSMWRKIEDLMTALILPNMELPKAKKEDGGRVTPIRCCWYYVYSLICVIFRELWPKIPKYQIRTPSYPFQSKWCQMSIAIKMHSLPEGSLHLRGHRL